MYRFLLCIYEENSAGKGLPMANQPKHTSSTRISKKTQYLVKILAFFGNSTIIYYCIRRTKG